MGETVKAAWDWTLTKDLFNPLNAAVYTSAAFYRPLLPLS